MVGVGTNLCSCVVHVILVHCDLGARVRCDLGACVCCDLGVRVRCDLGVRVWCDLGVRVWCDLGGVRCDLGACVRCDLAVSVCCDLGVRVCLLCGVRMRSMWTHVRHVTWSHDLTTCSRKLETNHVRRPCSQNPGSEIQPTFHVSISPRGFSCDHVFCRLTFVRHLCVLLQQKLSSTRMRIKVNG